MLRLHRGNLRMLLIIFGILFMSYSPHSFNTGVLVFFIGLLIHFASKGFLYRNQELAVNGPYSFVRHPFYIANLFLDIGIILMSGHPVFIILYLPLYYFSYHKVILEEEATLIDIYGDLYRKYMYRVPRYIPKLKPYTKDWYKGFKWENIMREREISRLLRLISYPISFLIIHELIKYKLHDAKIVQLLIGIGFTVLLLWTSYLFHNIIERDRKFKNINPIYVNVFSLVFLLLLGIIISTIHLGKIESNAITPLSILFFCLLNILLLNSESYWISALGDSFILLALCIYSGLIWLIPFSIIAVVFITTVNLRRHSKEEILFWPSKARILFYISILAFLIIKGFHN